MSNAKKYWQIVGHKGFDTFFKVKVPVGSMTEDQLKELLRCLSAKAGLTFDEIIGAYVKRKTKLAHGLLDVQKNGPYPEYMCGTDPSFVAIIVDEAGRRIKYPPLPWAEP